MYRFSSSSDTALNKEYVDSREDDNNVEVDDEEDVQAKQPTAMIPCLYCGKGCRGPRGIKQHEKKCDAKKKLKV